MMRLPCGGIDDLAQALHDAPDIAARLHVYFIGGIIKDRARLLVQSPPAMRQRFAVDVRTQSEIIRINRQAKTVVVSDKAMAAFIIAHGATAMGGNVRMFFTFWDLNLLRHSRAVPVQKTFIERMFGWMMPRGCDRTSLSKMNMAGLGTAMIKGIMRKKNVLSLPELIAGAKSNGVRLVACTMTMDLMGIKRERLIDGVEEGGVAAYLDEAGSANVNLFIG